ncbi:MAG: hypothetical protein ACTID4_15255 [Hafnia alvei]|jgi:predicted glycosyltransferase|uniref:hypothetical protein n=1 Tax=Hafnia alvei TaxID=569 RepID=UPI00248F166E|nr:hypothetical protein [Hafnia alvei]
MENLLTVLVICIVLFVVFRKFNLWYWKIQEHIDNQKRIIELLEKIATRAGSMDEEVISINRKFKNNKPSKQQNGLLDD